jgi:short-subunit dehydrogenase
VFLFQAFLTSFSEAIRVECKGTGVEVQTLSPGYVDTGFIDSNSHLLPRIFNPTPKKYAINAAATIGFMNSTSGYWAHELQVIIFTTVIYVSILFI